MTDEAKAKPEHPMKRLQREAAEKDAKIAELQAALAAASKTETVGPSPVPVASLPLVTPVAPEVFLMHLVIGINTHSPSALAPDAIASAKGGAALAYMAYCDTVRELPALLAKARAEQVAVEEREAHITRERERERAEQLQRRADAHKKVPLVQIRKTGAPPGTRVSIPSHLSAEEAALLAATGGGAGPRAND